MAEQAAEETAQETASSAAGSREHHQEKQRRGDTARSPFEKIFGVWSPIVVG